MINLLASLLDRSLDRAPVLQRRQRTLFEPAKDAVLTPVSDESGDSLREDDTQSESESSVLQKSPRNVADTGVTEPQVRSRTEHARAAAMLVPEAVNVTAVEAKPPFYAPAESTMNSNRQGDATIREEQSAQETIQPTKLTRSTSYASRAPLATIVETKVEREIVLQNDDDQHQLKESVLPMDSPKYSQPTPVNLVIARRPDAHKETPNQSIQTSLQKPSEQRPPTRHQTQHVTHSRLQPQSVQPAGPALPTINVTIGRVEVRASAPGKRAESARPAGPKLSLEDYLRGRSKGK